MMKSIVILYENNSKYSIETSFDGRSAKELCECSFSKLGLDIFKINKVNTVLELVSSIYKVAKENNADYIIFSYNDLPFIDLTLINKMVANHEKYKAEYTYADGYPYGFSPEVIDTGALGILVELASNNHKEEGEKEVCRESIYNLLKTEINSFEVEAVISDEDYRLLRLAFHCGKKENYLATLSLYYTLREKCQKKSFSEIKESFSADEISSIASVTLDVLKTVPGFYNIQIADKVSNNALYSPYNKVYEEKNNKSPLNSTNVMPYEKFSDLVDKIAAFSDTAVISLSLWGEAFSHKDILKFIEKILSYEGLSCFIETDGYLLDEAMCNSLKEIRDKSLPRTNGWDKLMIAVTLDSITPSMYNTIHEGDEKGFEKALNGISNLYNTIPEAVYPQFTRMTDNENELEGFFRYWNEKAKGQFIIQKYDDYAGVLPNKKPADLSPIERNVCWHLRRDFPILSNGDVPLCKSHLLCNSVGNVFNEELSDIWKKFNKTVTEHINKIYNEKCGKCDEFYTFNF